MVNLWQNTKSVYQRNMLPYPLENLLLGIKSNIELLPEGSE
jgi:hypothetical protein